MYFLGYAIGWTLTQIAKHPKVFGFCLGALIWHIYDYYNP